MSDNETITEELMRLRATDRTLRDKMNGFARGFGMQPAPATIPTEEIVLTLIDVLIKRLKGDRELPTLEVPNVNWRRLTPYDAQPKKPAQPFAAAMSAPKAPNSSHC